MSKKIDQAGRPPARERLLAAAASLFYEEGFNTVGIDRVIERAGVAKASLYDSFGSKEELILAYLAARKQIRESRLTEGLAHYGTPRERLLGVFDIMGELFAAAGFRGCAFIKAGADAQPGSRIHAACDDSRAWMRALFTGLARDAGAMEPESLARQLLMLYDGASLAAQMERDPDAAATARAMAAALLDVATSASK